MTDCPNAEIRDQLPDLLHDRLDAEARAAVLAHVGDCIDCKAEMDLLSGLRGTMTYVVTVDVTRVSQGVIAQTRSVAAGVPARGRAWANWRIAAAITVLAVGAGSVARMYNSSGVAVGPDSVAVAQAVAAPALQVAELSTPSEAEAPSESDLRTLISDLEELDALPALEPEVVAVPVTPVERAVNERSE